MTSRTLAGVTAFALVLMVPAMAGAWVEFTDETATRLVADPSLGVTDGQEKDYAWGDVDKDGDIDLIVARKQPFTTSGKFQNVLFMNEGVADGQAVDGVLVDRTALFASAADDGGQGFLDPTNDRDIILADINNDTWLDIITAVTLSEGDAKTISHPRIYINLQDDPPGSGNWQGFRYEEARIPQLFHISGSPAAPGRFCSVAAGDLTGDGWAEIYLGDYDSGPQPHTDLNDRLLLNDGTGHFTDSLESRMTSQMLLSAFGMASEIRDMNGDGFLDVVKDTALGAPQQVSISYNDPNNQGFLSDFDVVDGSAPYHTTVGDLNNDNRLDLVVTDDGQDHYLINQGNGADGLANFTSFGFIRAGGADAEFGGNSVIEDINNDGFNDVLITDVDVDFSGCFRQLHIYRNLGNLPNVTLQEQTSSEPWTPNGTHDVAVFDLNGDGWKDMIIGTCNGTEVWINVPPTDLVYTYPDGLVGELTPNQPASFRVAVSGTGDTPQPGTGKQFVSVDNGPFVETSMTEESPNVYFANLPGIPCTSTARFYFTVETTTATVISDPPNAPIGTYSALASLGEEDVIDDHFETAVPGWTVTNDPSLTTGGWERVDPIGTEFPAGSGIPAQPDEDFGAAAEDTMCYITEQYPGTGTAGVTDVDGGPTTLTSPTFDLDGSDAVVSYARWQFCSSGDDALVTEVNNGVSGWVFVDQTFDTQSAWEVASFKVSDFVTPSATMQVRFISSDNPNGSITESGVDNFKVSKLICSTTCGNPQSGDMDESGSTDGDDLRQFSNAMINGGTTTEICIGDFDSSGDLDVADIPGMVSALLTP